MIGTTLAIVSTAVGIGGAVKSHKAGKKASRAQRRANEAQRQINKLKNFQAKRQFLRGFRQAQAQVLTNAIAAGAGLESSAFRGTRSSQAAQAGTALREFERMDELGGIMTEAMNAQSRYQARAATWGAVSNFASQFIAFPAPTSTPGAGGQGGPVDTGGANRNPTQYPKKGGG